MQKITTVNTKPQNAVTYKMQNDHNLFINLLCTISVLKQFQMQ